MRKRIRTATTLYFAIGVFLYLAIKVFAGGLGIIGLAGPAGEALEFVITVTVWPLVVLVTVLVVMQGR